MKNKKRIISEKEFSKERTLLSEERTLLSNKRTFFSSIRTSIALAIAGIAFIGFSQKTWILYAGIICIILGFIVLVIGFINYKKMEKKIKQEEKLIEKGL